MVPWLWCSAAPLKTFLLAVLLASLAAWPAAALRAAGQQFQEEITVTSHRTLLAGWQSPSVTVLDSEDIARSGKTRLEQVLRQAPGVDVARTGGPGGQTSIFMRGTESDHTLVLLDGVPINDPRTGAVDIAFMDLAGVDRVEILRGPQATMHGALGGVIHIVSKGAAGGSSAGLRLDARGHRLSLGGSASARPWSLHANVLEHRSDGISAAAAGTEPDGHRGRQLGTGLSGQFGNRLFRADLNWHGSESDLDDYTQAPVDDPDYQRQRRRWQASMMLQSQSEHQVQQWRLSHHDIAEKFDNGAGAMDSLSDGSSNSFDSSETVLAWSGARAQQSLPGHSRLSGGAELRHAQGKEEAFSDSVFSQALWLQQDVDPGPYAISAGGRLQRHPEYGGRGDLSLSLLVPVSDWLFNVSYGGGYRPPAINELASPSFGNRQLSPESSRSVNLGWRYQSGQFRFWLEHFMTRVKNRIDYDFASMRLVNAGRARIRGYEVGLGKDWPRHDLSLRLDASRTDAIDSGNGRRLLRRPRYKWQLYLQKAVGAMELHVGTKFVGRRHDTGNAVLPSYLLLDLNLLYRASPRLSYSLRIDNVLDHGYQELRGYSAPGAEVFVGVHWQSAPSR